MQAIHLADKYYITSSTDTKGIITEVSNAFCIISGYSREELIGKSHSLVRHSDMPESVFKKMWQTIQSGKMWQGEVKNLSKDGRVYWVDSTIEPLYDDFLNIVGYKSLRFDITSQKMLQEQLVENQDLLDEFRLMFQTVTAGIAFVNNEGYFQEANPYMCEILGYSHEEILQHRCHDLTAPEFQEENVHLLELARTTRKAQKFLKKCRTKEGKYIWVEAVFQYFDHERLLIAVKNMQHYKILEEKNKMLLATSKQAAMGEMISMIAHQWRQPLTSLVALLSKTKIKYEMGVLEKKDFTADFDKAKNIIQHLSKTIDIFRDYFKEKEGKAAPVKELIAGVDNILLSLMESKSIEISCECSDKSLKVDDRLDQVILNIYQNAADALVQMRENNRRIFTKVHSEGENVIINICDNAGGVPESVIEHIFTPYFSTKSKNGSGLGLYMSKDIVENTLGGQLSVCNTKMGACFKITVLNKQSCLH